MAELKKRWSDGELLTVTYDGDRDGSATFTSDVNESIDREMVVTYVDKDRKVSVAQTVKQAGLREVFNASDGDFILADGGTFNVLKNELR
jgi:3-dehydroquinate synthase class II